MAYTATPLSKELLPGTSNYRVIVEFASDTPSTEPTFRKELIIPPDMTIAQGREWVYQQINNAKPKKSVADLIVIGTPVSPLAPTPPVPTADQVWLDQARRYRELKALLDAGIVAAQASTDLAALKTAVDAGYTTARGVML
jgi:hypothetical protein